MRKAIFRLRRQPEEVRRVILYLLMAFFGAAMIGFWIWSLGRDISDPDTRAALQEDLRPFSEFKNNLTEK